MNELLVGYARVSTEQQDLTSQRNGLHALGVGDDRIYVDHGLTGTNRDRPGLQLALAACRAGDTLVVTKLDRLARSLPDARDILDELTKRNVKLSLGGSIHDPTDPVGRLLFNVLAMVAEFEADLIRMRTREGMKIAKAKGRLRGKQPKLKPNQAAPRTPADCMDTSPQADRVADGSAVVSAKLTRRDVAGATDRFGRDVLSDSLVALARLHRTMVMICRCLTDR
jgi:DNA invertase Pin-like site-specific DNA recombinase